MGLLSKNERVCAHCGNTCKAFADSQAEFCKSCHEESEKLRKELLAAVEGYDAYRNKLECKRYSGFELAPIIEHKEKLVEKFTRPLVISREEIEQAGNNYRSLTDEQAQDILIRANAASVSSSLGAVYTDNFFVLTGYNNVIVDAADVFAVGIGTASGVNAGLYEEAILCAVFTNDPYIPVFPIVFVGKTGWVSSKSKKGREGVKAVFEAMCPNLTYPVEEIKALKKRVKNEDEVKGNISKELMLKALGATWLGEGVLDVRKDSSSLTYASANMLESMGYLQGSELSSLLGCDSWFRRRYWNKQMKKLNQK